MKAMVLGNLNSHLEKSLKSNQVEFEVFDTSDLLLYISEVVSGYDRIYNGLPSLDEPSRLKTKDYDFIVPRLSGLLEYRTVILEHLHKNLGIFSPQSSDAIKTASNKILTTLRLSQSGIRVPKTVWGKAPVHVDYITNKMLGGLPIVGKTVYGSQGAGVCLLETAQTTNTVLESFYKNDINVKLQRYIDGGFKDIRAIVVDGRVVSSMERTSGSSDFRANLSKSGTGKKIDLSIEDQNMCIDAAKAVGLEFAGVDLMKDKNGISYLIEVNGNPGTKIIDITGHNYFDDLIEYCTRKGKKSNIEKSPAVTSVLEVNKTISTDSGIKDAKNPFLTEADVALADLKKRLYQ